MAGSSLNVSYDGLQFSITADAEVLFNLSKFESEELVGGDSKVVEKKVTKAKMLADVDLFFTDVFEYDQFKAINDRAGGKPIVFRHIKNVNIEGEGFFKGEMNFNSMLNKVEGLTLVFTSNPVLNRI